MGFIRKKCLSHNWPGCVRCALSGQVRGSQWEKCITMVQSFQFPPITTIVQGKVVSDELICQARIFRRHHEVASRPREPRWAQHYTILQRGRFNSQVWHESYTFITHHHFQIWIILLPQRKTTSAESIIYILIFISHSIRHLISMKLLAGNII